MSDKNETTNSELLALYNGLSIYHQKREADIEAVKLLDDLTKIIIFMLIDEFGKNADNHRCNYWLQSEKEHFLANMPKGILIKVTPHDLDYFENATIIFRPVYTEEGYEQNYAIEVKIYPLKKVSGVSIKSYVIYWDDCFDSNKHGQSTFSRSESLRTQLLNKKVNSTSFEAIQMYV